MQIETFLDEIFFNTDMIGLIGPFALVVACFLIIKKVKELGLICLILQLLFVAHYLGLVGDTPDYWWHISLIFFGGILPLAFSTLASKK